MKNIFIRIFPTLFVATSLTSLTAQAQEDEQDPLSFASLMVQADELDPEKAANDALPNASKEDQKKAWLTSIDEGLKQAKAENKLVMIEFTGSDWCPPCIMMAKKVFGKTAFLEGVKKDYVIVKLDMPNSNPELKKANEVLLKKYKVTGVPTVLLFDAEGKEFTRFIASEHRTVKDFLKKLSISKRRKDMF